MAKQIVPQRVFDVARHADNQPAHQKPEDAFANGQSNNQRAIGSQLFARDGLVQAVHGVAHHPRHRQEE